MILDKIFSNSVSEVVDGVGSTIDKLFTSDEERMKAQALLDEIKNKSKEIDLEFNKQITERWKSDNEHFITRLVRPVSFAFMILVFAIISFMDGNIGAFKVNASYIPLYENLLITMTVAYFGARTYEKHSKNKHLGKNDGSI